MFSSYANLLSAGRTEGNDAIYYFNVKGQHWIGKFRVVFIDLIHCRRANLGGADDDFIFSSGNDVVHGFNANTTLRISGAEYSTLQSEGDVIVRVGNGSITLKNYTYIPLLNPLHIEGTPKTPELPQGISMADNALKISNAFKGKKVNANDLASMTRSALLAALISL